MGLLLSGAGDFRMARTHKVKLANFFFALFATDKVSHISEILLKEKMNYWQRMWFKSGITCESMTHPIP